MANNADNFCISERHQWYDNFESIFMKKEYLTNFLNNY